ncbi:MAG: DNA polymerase IV, partial [Romboutsia sp.]|nr:DNA polymerase IV [Romboutsia sp.]
MEIYRPKQATDRVIMHIDYDSFFASVEQQVNPKLRGRPIAVGGSSVRRGIVCAASREAKKLGVKTAMPLFKAKEICPDLIMVRGDGTKYKHIQKESLKIFAKYTDKVEPFSIDEAFLDVTATVSFFPSVRDMALRIKEDIKNNFGEYITCSIGIGPNKLVAKLVSDLEKPNGIVIV